MRVCDLSGRTALAPSPTPSQTLQKPAGRTDDGTVARLFNSSPIQPRRCRILLTKIALLLYTGEKFPTNEATTLFFGISKLFQNKDASLRQMVHLVIKELASSAEDIIMVTSTIMKDTGGSTDAIYRPNAIRALCRIIDVGHILARRQRPTHALLLTRDAATSLRRSNPLSAL